MTKSNQDTKQEKIKDPNQKHEHTNMELTQTSWQALKGGPNWKDELVWCLHVTHELF